MVIFVNPCLLRRGACCPCLASSPLLSWNDFHFVPNPPQSPQDGVCLDLEGRTNRKSGQRSRTTRETAACDLKDGHSTVEPRAKQKVDKDGLFCPMLGMSVETAVTVERLNHEWDEAWE